MNREGKDVSHEFEQISDNQKSNATLSLKQEYLFQESNVGKRIQLNHIAVFWRNILKEKTWNIQ